MEKTIKYMGKGLVSVEVRGNDIQKALKAFKRKVEASGHLGELRERRYYKKPSTIKRELRNRIQHRLKWEKTKKFTEK